ncbi:MAG: response regulator transcription factor [Bacteroidetes bacterium]|nr:response regulator transcription factor [Bacteroidota bacterium]
MSIKLLLVEDEKNFGLLLKDYLVMHGFSVTHCEDGELGLQAFKSEIVDLCIIDVMMPKKDGFTLSAEIKAINKNMPLIFLTARSMREDMIKGYTIGADDYVVKPFDSEVLLFKIKAILNRHSNSANEHQFLHHIGQFEFNAKLRTLKNATGVDVRLSPKEAALLNLLCQHKNDVLLREKALKQIWGDDNYFTARSMDVYIVKLRKYLASDITIEINNLHKNGYSLLVKS